MSDKAAVWVAFLLMFIACPVLFMARAWGIGIPLGLVGLVILIALMATGRLKMLG